MTAQATESAFVRRLAAAVRAAWWTLLVGVVVVIVQFSFYWAVSQCPVFWSWIARLLATDSDNARQIILFFMIFIRVVLVTWFLASIFLTLWLRRLRRVGDV